ncbi:MAG: SDR family NAD(P)-dependent oxidoreductase [Proteobacteria bacterium]|nr:SDR family NAD(P)-dependent oxidoreductase [Pseudomonadota bacterium]
MNPFKDKVCIITGAGSGIGRALSLELARRGALVLATDIGETSARETAQIIAEEGGKAESALLDVTDRDAVREIVEKTAAEKGRIDFLFNNAGIGAAGEFRDTPIDDWNRIHEVNVKGVLHGTHAAYPIMVGQGHGHIINTCSAAGIAPTPLMSAYSASKHAILGLSRAIRIEGADLGVKVSAICPGVVSTPMRDAMEFRSQDKQKMLDSLPMAITPERLAIKVLKGVEKNRGVIPVGLDAWFIYWVNRLFPGLYDLGARMVVRRSRKISRQA